MDAEQFSAAYRQYRPMLLAYFARHGYWNDAEDLVAETFERAWANRDQYTESGRFASWVNRIGHHVMVDTIRRQRREAAVYPKFDLHVADPSGTRELRVVEDADELAVLAVMEPTHRRLFALVAEGYNDHEAADRMGISHGAARQMKLRARSTAKRLLTAAAAA